MQKQVGKGNNRYKSVEAGGKKKGKAGGSCWNQVEKGRKRQILAEIGRDRQKQENRKRRVEVGGIWLNYVEIGRRRKKYAEMG